MTASGSPSSTNPFCAWGMKAATSRTERSDARGFPRDCITPVVAARVLSPGYRTDSLTHKCAFRLYFISSHRAIPPARQHPALAPHA